MKNTVGVPSTEWGLDLQDLPAPSLLHRAASPHAVLQVTKEGKSSLDTLQFKVSPEPCPSRSNAAFPPLPWVPYQPYVFLREQKKRERDFFTGNVEIGKSCFFPPFCFSQRTPVTDIQGRVLLLHRKIESFAGISQVVWLLVVCVPNLKLETPGYGWLIPESAGKEHFK